MIEQPVVQQLLTVANQLDVTALHFKTAKYWLMQEHADGVACFVGYEAKERWSYADDIRYYIIKHGGKIGSSNTIPVVKPETTNVHACLNSLLAQDTGVMNIINNTVESLFASGHHMVGIFLTGVGEKMQKDLMEVTEQVDHTGPKVSINLLEINEKLYEKYSHNSCDRG